MSELSHATGRVPAMPTSSQYKEFFTQIEGRRITREVLQSFLKSLNISAPTQEFLPLPIHFWMLEKGFLPASDSGLCVRISRDYKPEHGISLGFVRNEIDGRFFSFGQFRRPFVAVMKFGTAEWTINVIGTDNLAEFRNLALELEELYGVEVQVTPWRDEPEKEIVVADEYWDFR